MLAICAALRFEIRPVLKTLRNVTRVSKGPLQAWQGRTAESNLEVLVYQTGMGSKRAASSTRSALRSFPISALINTGCCGGLDPELCSGSLVLADRILLDGNELGSCTTNPQWAQSLVRAARTADLVIRAGPIVTTLHPLGTAAAKQSVRERTSAIAVDMESAVVALAASEAGIPFACARVVLDEASVDLPLTKESEPKDSGLRPLEIAIHVIRRPKGIAGLIGLAKASRACEAALERLFSDFLKCPPQMSG